MMPQLIETMRVDADGAMPLLARHVQRLAGSCAALGYAWPEAELLMALQEAAAALPAGRPHRLRLLLDRRGSWTMQSSELPELTLPVRVAVSPRPLDSHALLLRHKTTHRPWYSAAAGWLDAHPDHFDVLFFNERGELCEGSRSNVYVLQDGQWLTPAASCGLLPGVQRAQLLDEGKARESVLTAQDLRTAQGLRLSNALRGWFDATLQREGGQQEAPASGGAHGRAAPPKPGR